MSSNFYIYGRNALLEALSTPEAKESIEKIYLVFGAQGAGINQIYKLAKENKIPIVTRDKIKYHQLEKEAGIPSGNSQGVIALKSAVRYFHLNDLIEQALNSEENPILLVLDEISDPHNLGAIARSAECSGVFGLVIPERNSAPITGAALKASAGALEHIKIAKVGNLNQALLDLKNAGFWIAGAEADGDKKYYEFDYNIPLAFVIGSEGQGIRPSVRNKCDYMLSIPMKGKINSLNASVATSILLFHRLYNIEINSGS